VAFRYYRTRVKIELSGQPAIGVDSRYSCNTIANKALNVFIGILALDTSGRNQDDTIKTRTEELIFVLFLRNLF
jgi:hypothetical protein